MNTLIIDLAKAISAKDNATMLAIGTRIMTIYGYTQYKRMYKQANTIANTKPYTFIDFTSKGFSDSADKSYVSSKATHNED